MIEIDWIGIPAGQFQVGCDDWQILQIRQKLGHAHRSKLDAALSSFQRRTISSQGFFISRYPITHAQMDEFFKHFPDLLRQRVVPSQDALASFPEETEWSIADLFCRWVGGRLPTADEWLLAAQGPEPQLYPWGNEWDASRGNFTGSPDQPGYPQVAKNVLWSRATPVNGYSSGVSPYGVWDMAGNLSEWTMTCKPAPYTGNDGYVVRGNSAWDGKESGEPLWYYNILAHERVAGPESIPIYIGFRPVKDYDKAVVLLKSPGEVDAKIAYAEE